MAPGAGVALAIALAAAACSSPASRPPLLQDCQANDAGCSVQPGGGGGGGADDAGPLSCAGMDFSGSSQCDQCAALRCCSSFTPCSSNTSPCGLLLGCEVACGALASCVSRCPGIYPAGQTPFDELELCLQDMCPVCGESGIGDPCSGSGTSTGCAPGLTCIDGWCSTPCTSGSTCAGLGPGGTNGLGLPNACLTIAGARDVCVPGCATSSDCANFANTVCFPATAVGGATVQVCSPADAGL